MNKMRFLAFAIFISLFSFVNSMSKTKEEVKSEQRNITKEDLIKAMKTLDVGLVKTYKQKGGKISSDDYKEFCNILYENWNWTNYQLPLREQVSLVAYGLNASVLPAAVILLLSKILSKQKWFQELMTKNEINYKAFDLPYRVVVSPIIVAMIFSPLSLWLYYAWQVSEKEGQISTLLNEMSIND